eukprot:4448612-Amphidinium_carterae.1
MIQNGFANGRYWFRSPSAVHRAVHSLFGLSRTTIENMKVLGMAISQSEVEFQLTSVRLTYMAGMSENLTQWVHTEDSTQWCRSTISRYECIMEMSAYAKYGLTTPEMVMNLKNPSGNQASKVSATVRTHAKGAYDRIMEAMESESDTSDSETSEVKKEPEVEFNDIMITRLSGSSTLRSPHV